MAVSAAAQPSMMFHPNVDGMPPIPSGLKVATGPRRERSPAVLVNRSARVLVHTTGPGWSMIRSASMPLLPDCGGASISTWSCIRPYAGRPYWARPNLTA